MGKLFGPIMMVWFITIGLMGVHQVVQNPAIFAAINPLYAIRFLIEHSLQGFIVLGAVFLVLTGAEALYADMGHFGLKPIRMGWFFIVMPCLLLNYFGQGAMFLNNPDKSLLMICKFSISSFDTLLKDADEDDNELELAVAFNSVNNVFNLLLIECNKLILLVSSPIEMISIILFLCIYNVVFCIKS